MLFAYLDEAGIGDSRDEAHVVVAGVILFESQWKKTVARIKELVGNYVPKELQGHFIFHAKEMFHGNGPVWGKDVCTQERRLKALADLLRVPVEVGLLIVHSEMKKSMIKDDHPLLPRKNGKIVHNGRNVCAHAFASSQCMLIVERAARTFAPHGDLVQ